MSIGTDPEIFLKSGRNVIPAFKFLPKKENGIQKGVYGTTVYNDGFQAEMSCAPSGCIAHVIDDVQAGLKKLAELGRKYDPKAVLSLENTPHVSAATLKDTPEEYVIFGCKPSFNAYERGGEQIDDPRRLLRRFSGGHLHFSFGYARNFNQNQDFFQKKETIEPIVKDLDALLGIYFVGAAAEIDDPVRRRYYGLAGEYRLPPHGVEYRVLSNAWLSHPAVANVAMMFGRGIIRLHDKERFFRFDDEEVQDVINKCDVKNARRFMKRHEKLFKEVFGRGTKIAAGYSGDPIEIKHFFEMGIEGIESKVNNPRDIERNWDLFSGKYVSHCEGAMHSWTKFVTSL